ARPMNVLPARLAPGPALRLGRGTILLPGAPGAAGDGWTAGLRPEALHVVPDDTGGAVPAHVEHLESLGHETLAHLRLEGDDAAALVARIAGMPPLAAGQRVGVVVEPAQVRLFDAEGRLVR